MQALRAIECEGNRMSALSRLPPLKRKVAPTPKPAGDWSSPDWALDARAPVINDCIPCAGRGKFVSRTNATIKLECEWCEGRK